VAFSIARAGAREIPFLMASLCMLCLVVGGLHVDKSNL
jgi:hypothetical protein